MEWRVSDLIENTERVRVDRVLSTLKLLGIREHLPKRQADIALEDLKNVEDIIKEEDLP